MFNILSLLVGVFYIALGIFVIIKKFFLVALEGLTPYLLGGLLIAYGIFRIIRAIIFLRKKDE
ncbi:MAG: C4-dicarboxylate ABC transporter [Cloacibacterium sp.]|jgi:uncharacterized membrane protein HdeD (DUF308 family)|nr:C4-dicarboxylate ABC transporter [Cloacibacterium sp.]